jgi:t-SNARE complex subunit (syntaxin)
MSLSDDSYARGPQSVDTDFLSEIQGDDGDDYVDGTGKATVITKTFKAEEDEQMRDFMQKKDLVLSDLDIIVEKTNEVKRITHQLEDVYADEETKELQKELQENVKSGDYRSIRAKKKLNQLKKSTKELKKSQNKRVKSQLQIRRNIQQTLEKRFIDVTRDLQEAKGNYRTRLRQNITRQVQIADPQATEDDISEAIENGTAHDLIQRALNRSSLGHQAFKDKLDDVTEKSRDIKELEQSMLKLKQMFEDLAQLIEMQSEQIDAIEVRQSTAGGGRGGCKGAGAGGRHTRRSIEEAVVVVRKECSGCLLLLLWWWWWLLCVAFSVDDLCGRWFAVRATDTSTAWECWAASALRR